MNTSIWVGERDALALHGRLLALHGGAAGLCDDGLLESALHRPRQHFAYAESPDMIDLASLYTAGLVQNHPFVDGNKRTAFVVGILFLELNGYRFTASEEDSAEAVLALASRRIDESAITVSFVRMRFLLTSRLSHPLPIATLQAWFPTWTKPQSSAFAAGRRMRATRKSQSLSTSL